MITKETIDKIFSAIRVEEIVGEYVQLKRAGSNYKGLSPFVDEKTPSFIVSPSKQIWKDFSSGKGGTAISFLMEIEGFSYPEALRYAAKKYGIEIEELKKEGLWFAAADMDGEEMYGLNLKGPLGLVIGNEGKGVSELVRKKCDFTARIPMLGQIDSLNASVAAGVLAYEVLRQRRSS